MIRQSKAALPQEITELNVAETIRLCVLLYTKYMDAAQAPDAKVLNTARNDNDQQGNKVRTKETYP